MTRMGYAACRSLLAAAATLWAGRAMAQVLTADQAVQLALRNNSQVVNSEADLLQARSGLYGAYSGVLPRVSASVTRSGVWQDNRSGSQVFGGLVVPTDRSDYEQYSTSPAVTGSWSVLDLSGLSGVSAARTGLRAARFTRGATRNDVVLSTRRQFYEVVRAEHLARVANSSLRLSRDNERRVNALFQVGSVSRSDLLTAQVRTAQSELDSLTARQLVTNQRLTLASLIGVHESELAAVDTTLGVTVQNFDRGTLQAEAEKNRPDLAAAEAGLRSARMSLRSANLARWPYVTVSGGLDYKPRSTFKVTTFDTNGVALPVPNVASGRSENDLDYNARVSLNLDLFNGFQTESQIASARARLVRAQETLDALRRNLGGEVQQALIAYDEAVERERVARRALEASAENVRLTQQKYNVGSATILELIDAQVSLQRAESDVVSALAAIRVAEAQIERVRGRAQ